MPHLNPFGLSQLRPTYYDRKVIPAEQVKTLFSVPITIIPVKRGYLTILDYIVLNKPAGIAYVLNGNTEIKINAVKAGGTLVPLIGIALPGFLDQAGATYYVQRYQDSFGATIPNDLLNNSWNLKLDVADMVTGTGDLELAFIWEEIPSRFPKL